MTSDLVFRGGGRERPLTVIRRAGARGLRLSVDPRDASVRLSLPPRAPLRPALAWAITKRGWIEAELARMPVAQPIVPGMVFELAGASVRLDWSARHARTPQIVGGTLLVGGPIEQMPQRILRYLQRAALQTLETETRALATAHGLPLGTVGVGDARTRWGSCASNGTIRYSWRLILAPAFVRRATVAHEVAHLVHMNHSPAFHALVRELFGSDPTPARRWLRTHGAGLYWFGRSG
ncbi:MAG: M48 family metallopeptidase [Sphingomonadaceae bacterium]